MTINELSHVHTLNFEKGTITARVVTCDASGIRIEAHAIPHDLMSLDSSEELKTTISWDDDLVAERTKLHNECERLVGGKFGKLITY